MKFCLIKRVSDDKYLCSEFEYGQDPHEMTFTAVGINASDVWLNIAYVCGADATTRLTIFENEENAKRHIRRIYSYGDYKQEDYVVILLADLDIDKCAERGLLDEG